MPRIFDFGGREVERSQTVAGLRALKGTGHRAAQVTAETAEEAAAAEMAGIEMVVCRGVNISRVREGSKKVFVTAALGFADAVTTDEILRSAFAAVTGGADAVITGRGFDTVQMLANEQIPVVGHLGFVPRKSTWIGSVRAVGKTADEAFRLWEQFQRLEEAGAFAVECEVVPGSVMAEINARTGLVTISLGSGRDADVIFLFSADVTGEATRLPRHARAWGKISELQTAIREERRKSLKSFRAEVEAATFPSSAETVSISEEELAQIKTSLDRAGGS